MVNRKFSILSALWLIHDSALSLLPLIESIIQGKDLELKPDDALKPFVVGCMDPCDEISLAQRWELDDENLPENSVAVVPIDGIIFSWDTMYLMNQLMRIKQNPQINSVLFLVNSPGGMVNQIDVVANMIKDLGKPTVALVMGLACSSAYWLISGASYRISSSPMDMIGSIGTKSVIDNISKMLELNGIKRTEFYATKSTRKDEQVRAFLEDGNKQPMMDMVDFANEVFHQAIMDNVGIAATSEVFTGAAYYAQKAKELGLINEINTLDYAIQYAYQLGLKNKIIIQSKQFNF